MKKNSLAINTSNEYLIFDLDADGDMDFLEIGEGVSGRTNATRWYYDGKNFQKDMVSDGFSSFNQDNKYVVVDANNDGLTDLVEVWKGENGTANATTYWGDQEGRFGSSGNFTHTWNFGEFNPSKYAYVGIDYNNDGWQDLVRRNNNPLEGEAIWQPYLGDGEGLFTGQDSELSIDDVSLAEDNEGNTEFSFTVSLSGASTETITVDYATEDDSAVAGEDYTAINGTLEFAPGEIEQTITVEVTGDTEVEEDETFNVNLSNASNAELSDSQGIGTITNDDEIISNLSIDDVSLSEDNKENTELIFTVSLEEASTETITVNYTTKDDSAVAGEDYTAINGTLEFAPGETEKTITVEVLNDSDFETDEAFKVILSNASNADLSDGEGIGTITNEEVDLLAPTPDEPLGGSLENSDDFYLYKDKKYYYDFFSLPVDSTINSGDTIDISLTSNGFEPMLMILDFQGDIIEYNHGSTEQTMTARLTYEVGSEPFFVSVESMKANVFGDYQFEVVVE